MKTLKQYFQEAMDGKWAIGHFNFSTADQLKAIVEAAAETNRRLWLAPRKEAEFIGYDQAVALLSHTNRKVMLYFSMPIITKKLGVG